MRTHAEIDFLTDGSARCLYHELLDLQTLGRLRIRRASRVEFNSKTQRWEVIPDAEKTVVFSSPSRAACIDWERDHLRP